MWLKRFEFAKYKTYLMLGGVLLCFILLFGGMFLVHASSLAEEESEELSAKVEEDIPKEEESREESTPIVVDVKGAVANPGVYHLAQDSYVYQAIEAAGGLLENANTSLLNLSKHVTDSMVIIVYTKEEIDALRTSEKEIQYIEVKVPCECPDTMNDACIKIPSENSTSSNTTGESDTISLNQATLEELLHLNGIGESKAKAIITYREENGPFKGIEDIKNVKGIGEALFEKIKNQIIV